MTPSRPFCALVDWGTSSFRIWLVGEDGAILDERRSREGMNTVADRGFGAILERHLVALGAAEDLPVMICGMAGARQGWIEAPYADTPADVATIAAKAIRVPGTTRDIRILPGVAQRPGEGGADVMRGEETQVMGLAGDGSALLCLPGTHSKWIEVEEGRILRFSTFMTGEIFALLSQHSILRHSLTENAEVLAEPAAFTEGVAASLAEPALIMNRIFSLRAEGLFGIGTPAEATARLSGLVLGLEIAGARAAYSGARDVILVSSGPLADLYRMAFETAGIATTSADADAAVRRGLLAAARHSFDKPEPQP